MAWLEGKVRFFEQDTIPTVDDDQNDGYQISDLWIYVDVDGIGHAYRCVSDAVGVAVWDEIDSARSILIPVKEENTSVITKGQACAITGSSGIKIEVGLANCCDPTHMRILGLAFDDIAKNGNGSVVYKGIITGIDTRTTNADVNPNGETWEPGDLLWVIDNAGGMSKDRPDSGRSIKAARTVKGNSNTDILIVIAFINPVWATAAADEDIVQRMGDVVGVNKVSYRNFLNAEVGWIDSLGDAELKLLVARIGDVTYDDIQDWLNNTQSGGRIEGGELSDGGSGGVAHSAIKGFIKTSDSDIGITKSFELAGGTITAGETSPNIVNNAVNYLYIDCVDGTTPTVKATTDRTAIHLTDQFTLGRAWREDNYIDFLTSGITLNNYPRRSHERLIARSKMEHMSGNALSATGLTIAATAGKFYVGLNSLITALKLAVTNFEHYYYRDSPSGWIDVSPATNAIDTDYYDDGSGTLAELLPNRYSVHWSYICFAGDLSIVYGRGDYTLAQANAAQPPGDLPDYLDGFGVLCGKVIVQKGAAVLTSLESAWVVQFSPTVVSNHNDLGGLNDGDYKHLTATEYAALGGIAFQTAAVLGTL